MSGSGQIRLAAVGNPNSGKTTLFNHLTGSRQKIGNWPGVTVEKKSGYFEYFGNRYELVDLPGTYSLSVSHDDDSIDQQIAQNFILDEPVDCLINIIDATSLERGLYLTSQLLDTGIPTIVVLNMMDVADNHGITIDTEALSRFLGLPVVPIVASKQRGLRDLLAAIQKYLDQEPRPAPQAANLGETLETAIADVQLLLDRSDQSAESNSLLNPDVSSGRAARLLATAALAEDASVLGRLDSDLRLAIEAITRRLESENDTAASDQFINARYHWIAGACSESIRRDSQAKVSFTDRLDNLLLNRLLAFPMFLGVMYLMFLFTIHVGGAFIDVFDQVAGALLVELPHRALFAIGTPAWLTTLIADGIGGGIQLVASFIPVIGALFLFQSFLEGSGYMARAAFIVDRLMRSLGLPGKSFVPLIVGFGCNVPAVMSARALDSHNDRLLTTLMAPFMSCGARLTVYILFATVFFPAQGQNVVFGLYLLGIVMAVLTGALVKKRLMNRDLSFFVMELPNYHLPTMKSLLMTSWHRLRGFILRAGKAIVLVVVVLNFVNSIGTDGSFGNENSEKSVLSVIGMKITPLFEPMGVQEDNWPATVGIFSGIFAKEVVVGTLDSLYTAIANADAPAEEGDAPSIGSMLADAFATVPENLAGLGGALLDPLGLGVGDLSNQESSAADQEVHVSTFVAMSSLYGGALAAFSYILFVLLYMPCVATLGAIYKEAGGFWAFFAATWNTLVAYALAVICFQSGALVTQTGAALGWIVGMVVLVALGAAGLFWMARRHMSSNTNLIPVRQIG